MRAKRKYIKKDKQVFVDDVEEKMDLINSLDNDSLAQIFMMLPISERITMNEVCSKWKEACQLAWHDIKKYKCSDAIVRGYEKCISTQSYVEKVLFNCGIYLKELILSKICDSSIMPIIGEYCKNLTALEFEIDVNMDDRYTDRFVEAFTQLKQLKVVKIHIFGHKFQFQTLNRLQKDINEIHLFFGLAKSHKLSGFSRRMCFLTHFSTYDVSPSLFSLRKFTNLRSLTIRSYDITDIIQEISKKTTLVYLNLQKCETDDEIFTFNQLSNLEHLNIKDVSFKDSQSQNIRNLLGGIFNACKNLKHLDAPDFHVDLAEIKVKNWVNLKNLVYLNIRWQASDAIIDNIIKYCNNLEFINIHTLDSESTIIILTKLENLNYLKFAGTNNINNEVMVAILNHCKKLKHLVIHGSYIVEASIFDDLSKLQYIENLNLSFSSKLGNSAIIAIAKNCKLLKCLNIEKCYITSSAYIALTSLKNLKELNVRSNDNIEDNFIVKLRGIKSFNCSVCNKLTDGGVIQFIKNNPDLEFLNISFNTKVTIDTIIAADEVSKNRTNDTFLSIKTSGLYLKSACIKSQWLTCD